MATAVTFGEAMLRLSPPHFQRLEQATSLDVTIGGAELNAAVGLARLGIQASWISALPDNALGRLCANKARELGVDTENIHWRTGERMGLYFVEFAATPRSGTVLYDRAASAASKLAPGVIDWANILTDVSWFHTTGITPALSDDCAGATAEALKAARAANCLISYDLNYRANLWSLEKARIVQMPLMQYVDVLFAAKEAAAGILGVSGADEIAVAEQLCQTFGFSAVVMTQRQELSAWHNRWSAMLYTGGISYQSRQYEVEIVDRIGAGDACCAGYISQALSGADPQKAIDFAAAFSALKHTIPGDFNLITAEETQRLLDGSTRSLLR